MIPVDSLEVFSIAGSRAVDPDPHSFSLLDPDSDPGGTILREKTENMQGN